MKHHLKYLKYLLRHKWFVFRAGLFFRSPLWHLIIHAWSKFLPSEWIPYARYFYVDGSTSIDKQRFDVAWLRHQHRSPHHWQYWVLKQDDGQLRALHMPAHFTREMVADWTGAGKAISGEWMDVYSWYAREKDKMLLHPQTRIQVEEMLNAARGDWFWYYGWPRLRSLFVRKCQNNIQGA